MDTYLDKSIQIIRLNSPYGNMDEIIATIKDSLFTCTIQFFK
jgi:hypothetical protein